MGNELEQTPSRPLLSREELDVVTKISTATAMALSTSFSLERRNLAVLDKDSMLQLGMRIPGDTDMKDVRWIEVQQIGRPEDDSIEASFSALQKILHAFQLPKTRLLFLITGEERNFKLFLGLSKQEGYEELELDNAIRELNLFCEISWPGLKTCVIEENRKSHIGQFIQQRYDKAYALTGIPSMDLDKTKYPSTVELLLGGCKSQGKIAYLVVADPVSEMELDNILYSCDEMSGQAENFKSFNLTKSLQKGTSETITETVTETIGKSTTDGTSQRDASAAVKGLVGIGLTVAAVAAFPPAAALVGTGATALASMTSAATAAQMIGGASLMGIGLLSSFIPQKTHSEQFSTQHSNATSTAQGVSENYSVSLGSTVVNGHVASILEELKLQHERFLSGKAKGMWRVGCYLLTDHDNATSHVQLKSILSGEASRLEPIRVHDITRFTKNAPESKRYRDGEVVPFINPPELRVVDRQQDVFNHPFGEQFSHLTTYLTTDELTSMVNFPLHSVPGISVLDKSAEFRLDVPVMEEASRPLNLGQLLYHGGETDMLLQTSMDGLARHTLICGANGSGKTNTVLGILGEVSRNRTNFMVIEPAKTEYVDWAIHYNEKLLTDQQKGLRKDETPIIIYMPGKKSYWHADEKKESVEYTLKDTLRLNPFEPVAVDGKVPDIMSHLDRIKSIFALAFPMEDILPTVMESLLRDVYTNGENWLKRRPSDPYPEHYPTLGLLACRTRSVIASLGYEPRVTSNIYAAINLRLSNLLSGWKRELLNNEVLGGYKKLSRNEEEEGIVRPTWDDFFNRKVIINLSGVADDNDRSFVMGLLLLYLYEYRIALSERKGFSFNANNLMHLTVIEEAHRVMMNNPNPDSPQFKCGQLFSNLLSEIRAYGEGMMIVDQVPGRLIPDAVKNTNLKIIHRLISYDDIELVSKSMGISEEQQKIIPKLGIGQAVVAGICIGNDSDNSTENIYWCKINKAKPS